MAASPALREWHLWAPAFLAGACVWTFVSAAVSGGDPVPVVAVLAAAAGSLILAAAVSRRNSWLVPGIVVGAAAILAVVSRAEILSTRPEQGPFDYANATGAFYLQATVAALMLAAVARTAPARTAAGIAAAAFAGISVATGSAAAAWLLFVPAAGFVLSVRRSGRRAVIGSAVLFAGALLATVVIGAFGGGSAGKGGVVDERRQALWYQAVTTIAEKPLTGVGPGGFVEEGVRIDPDARWAHHGFLQLGAETGIPGLGLVVLAFAWLFTSFADRAEPTALTVLGAASLAVFGIGACVDYLMHFPAIPVTAAALAGAASSYIDV